VGDDQCLGVTEADVEALDAAEKFVDFTEQGLCIAGVESAGNGGRSECSHFQGFLKAMRHF
jgi:hypothetical protein